MITKQDCMILLNEIGAVDKLKELIILQKPTPEIIKFINDNRELDLTKFYTKIRKSYNNKKSKLYINIVRDIEEPQEIIITLSALLNQINIFAKNVDNKELFLRSARSKEITIALHNYYNSFDITSCLNLLRIIKADLKICEALTKSE